MQNLRRPQGRNGRIWLRVLEEHLYTFTLGEWHLVASFGENDGETEPSWCSQRGRSLAPYFAGPPNVQRPNWCLMMWCRNQLVQRVHVVDDRKAFWTACRMLREAYRLSLAIDEATRLEATLRCYTRALPLT